ncbi:MAG: PAS domain-containing sensor histidine kinase [Betaproteobacteria bacterium]
MHARTAPASEAEARLKAALEQLREKEAQLRAIIEHEPECVKMLDAEGRVVEMNPAGLAMIGADGLEAVAGACVYPLVVAEHRDAFRALTERVCRGEPGGTLQFEIIGLKGHRRWLETHVTPIRAGAPGETRLLGVTRDITERKRAEQLLQDQFHFVNQLLAAMPNPVFFKDEQGRYLGCNRAFEEFIGMKREDMVGRTVHDLAPKELADIYFDADRKLFENPGEQVYEASARAADGSQRQVMFYKATFTKADGSLGGLVGSIADITPRVEAERRIQGADIRLREAIEHLNEPVCITDAEDRIVVANRSFRELNAAVADCVAPGRRYDEHLREGIRLGQFPEAEGRVEEWLAERMARRHAGSAVREVRRQGGIWLLVRDQKLADGGTVSFGLDITKRKNDEVALRDINRELERRVGLRTAQLEEAIREMEAFSYSVSHDLRAPLRAIGGFARMVIEDESGRLSEDGRRKLEVVEANARRMGMLVDDLLQLARVNRSELRREPLDMGALAASVAAELGPLQPRARLEVATLPGANGDPVLVRQALANLVDNALKYSARAAAPRVEVGWDGAEGAWFVRDNGIGFDMAHAKKLFDTFERLHGEAFEGTGIGLAIVRRVAERHGGRVWAEAAPGQGAAFYFTLG